MDAGQSGSKRASQMQGAPDNFNRSQSLKTNCAVQLTMVSIVRESCTRFFHGCTIIAMTMLWWAFIRSQRLDFTDLRALAMYGVL
jgi:hypothetical protein